MQHSASTNNNTLAEDKGQAFDQEVVEAFQSLFWGRIDVRGELYDESNPDDPKYVTKAEPVTLKQSCLTGRKKEEEGNDFEADSFGRPCGS
jgi:hypothetical protein